MNLEQQRLILRHLRQLMGNYFDIDELKTLAYDLAIDWDQLQGDTKSARLHTLIKYLDRHNRLPELFKLLQEERHDVIWPDFLSEKTSPAQQIIDLSVQLSTVKDLTVNSEPTLEDNDVSFQELPVQELGLFELVEISETQFQITTDSILNSSESMRSFSRNISQRTEEINKENTKDKPNRKRLKQIFSFAANDMNTLASRLETEISILDITFKQGIKAISYAVDVYEADFAKNGFEPIKKNLDSVSLLFNNLIQGRESIKSLHKAVEAMPRVTSDVNKAKRNLSLTLMKVVELFEQQQILTEELKTKLGKILEGLPSK